MAYITREDGERLVIPSYRDVLSAKKQNLLKREILLLSTSYGEYITLQRKNAEQYEVAFSNEPGYLFGETVWNYFKRPQDLVYCEEIPNTTEAILVVVKSGSVHLDGVFPLDSIADELVVFRTQQNSFDIYIQGDVPITKTPAGDRFYFNAASVKSFTVLESPVFQTMPLLKAFQLQLVDSILRYQGIGVFPMKQVIGGLMLVACIWIIWSYFSAHNKQLPQVITDFTNPYQVYLDKLTAPDPAKELESVFHAIEYLSYIPGWHADSITYQDGILQASVKSRGARTNVLFEWAQHYRAKIIILPEGFNVSLYIYTPKRPVATTISPMNEVIATVVDRLSYVLPGNNLQVGPIVDRRAYSDTSLTIKFEQVPLTTLEMVRQTFADLPLVLVSVSMKTTNGDLSGTIVLQALGN